MAEVLTKTWTTVSVGAEGSLNCNLALPAGTNSLLLEKIQITPSVTGDSSFVLYRDDTFAGEIAWESDTTDRNPFFDPVKLDSAGVITNEGPGVICFYEDEDETEEFHLKIFNDALVARTYEVKIWYSEFVVKTANLYYPNYSEADQGATGAGKSVKAYIDAIVANSATLLFRHNSGAATTTYTFSTDETIPSNINVVIDKGAILSIDSAKTLTINKLQDPGLYQVFSGAGSVSFGVGSVEFAIPQWWGALGDATADDTAEINAAFAAYTRVLIPKVSASYLVTAPLTPIDNQVITVEGEIKTAQPAVGAFNIFNIVSKSNVTIIGKGGIITGDGATGNLVGIKSITSSNITVVGMEVTAVGYGIWLRSTTDVNVKDIYVHDILYRGIQVGYSADASYNYFNISDNRVDTVTGSGIETQEMSRGTVTGNVVSNISKAATTSVGIMVYHGNRVAVTGNSLFEMGAEVDGIVFYEAGSNNSCTGNTIHGTAAGAGVQVSTISGMTVAGNQINGTFLKPIRIDGDAQFVSITGNSINATTATGAGIEVTARGVDSPSYVTIIGNTVRNTTGGSLAGINIDKDSIYINITGNIIYSNFAGIELGTDASYININDNDIQSYSGYGIWAVNASNHIWIRGNTINPLVGGGSNPIVIANTADYITIYDNNETVGTISVTSTGKNIIDISTQVTKKTITYANFSAATTIDKVIATIPAKTKVISIYADTTTAFTGGGESAVAMIVGYGGGGAELIATHSVLTAAVTKGLADADMGSGMTRAAAIQGGSIKDWTTAKNITARYSSTANNLNALTAGSTTFYVRLQKMGF